MRTRHIPRIADALVAGGLCLGGCTPIAWTRVTVNHPLHPRDVAFIVPRQTTWDEVIRHLGVPDELARAGDGLAADYFSLDSKSFSVNLGWPLNFVGPVSSVPHDFVLGAEGIGANTFEVAFDAHDVVVYEGFLRGGPAAQYRISPFNSPSP